MKCLQCKSEDILKDITVFDQAHGGALSTLIVGFHKNPEALLFKKTEAAYVMGNVCLSCGFLMLSISKSDAVALSEAKKQL